MMNFGETRMAGLFWLVALAGWLVVYSFRKSERMMRRFADSRLWGEVLSGIGTARKRLKGFLVIAALALIALALTRPQFGYTWRRVERKGLDIMIALDTSNSMLAEDVRPNRLERAKLAVHDLLGQLGSDRAGLIVFSGKAFLKCPLTSDHAGFRVQLDDVDNFSVPVGGTAIAEAIHEAVRAYSDSRAEGERVLIIISDGEDHAGGLERAVRAAVEEDIRIFTVGVGSREGGMIPLRGITGESGFLRDTEGNPVRTRLREVSLRMIAEHTGAAYVHATGAVFGLEELYDRYLAHMQKKEYEERMERVYHERFQIPLALALLLLFIEPLIGRKEVRK